MTDEELLELAIKARKNAYAPYSDFHVGAALLCTNGTVYTGCNIENASFSPTICAERVAVFKAISEGRKEFSAIAVVGGKGNTLSDSCPPCGVCRQVLSEFCQPDFKVILGTKDHIQTLTLKDLLPHSFIGKEQF